LAQDGKNPGLVDSSVLGACRSSNWPRTCSFWLSLHAMAYLADANHVGTKFLQMISAIIAGGALQCGACTQHFRMFHARVLSQAIKDDVGTMY